MILILLVIFDTDAKISKNNVNKKQIESGYKARPAGNLSSRPNISLREYTCLFI
jgi:hypothetical protein